MHTAYIEQEQEEEKLILPAAFLIITTSNECRYRWPNLLCLSLCHVFVLCKSAYSKIPKDFCLSSVNARRAIINMLLKLRGR